MTVNRPRPHGFVESVRDAPAEKCAAVVVEEIKSFEGIAILRLLFKEKIAVDQQITAQNLVAFRNLATRPKAANGLGLSAVEAEAQTAAFEAAFPLLVETPDIFPAWKTLVAAMGVVGKQVYDARLVAVCHVHGVTHLLTFNVSHFTRLGTYGPGLVIVDPATV
jgi:hypothetical protein